MKRYAAIAGIALAALAGAFWAGRATAPRPAVHAVESQATQQTTAKATQTHQDAAPVDVDRKVTKFRPVAAMKTGAPQACSPCEVAEVVEEHVHRGEVVTETRSVEATKESEQTHLDLTVTPQAAPGWAVSVGLDDPLGARQVRVALRRRLFGPFAVEVAAVPARGMAGLGAGIAVEF